MLSEISLKILIIVFLGTATRYGIRQRLRRLGISSSFFSAAAVVYSEMKNGTPYGLFFLLLVIHVDELLPNVPKSGTSGDDSTSSNDNLSGLAIHLLLIRTGQIYYRFV